MEKRMAYFVSRVERDERGWIPCIAVEGEPGFHKTDWRWDCDFETAQKIADERNLKLGLGSRRDADVIVASSMRAQNLASAKKSRKVTRRKANG